MISFLEALVFGPRPQIERTTATRTLSPNKISAQKAFLENGRRRVRQAQSFKPLRSRAPDETVEPKSEHPEALRLSLSGCRLCWSLLSLAPPGALGVLVRRSLRCRWAVQKFRRCRCQVPFGGFCEAGTSVRTDRVVKAKASRRSTRALCCRPPTDRTASPSELRSPIGWPGLKPSPQKNPEDFR